MINRRSILAAIGMFRCLSAASATDLIRMWRGDLKTPSGDNLVINFNFHVDGEKLTGTVANTYGEEQIADGIVKGDAVSFVILAGADNSRFYKGTVAGGDLKLHVMIGEMGEGDLIAEKSK